MQKLIRQILTSRVYEAAIETPLDYAPQLSAALGNHVYLKREDLQPVFSFKLRGAYNRMACLEEGEKKRGVIAASAGNHAQGVAFSAQRLGIRAMIVMPVTTPEIKVEAVRRFGAEVVLHGDNYSEAAAHCEALVQSTGMTFIHPFDDELVIAGQGTVADELVRQTSGRMDVVFVPVGGGGLIAGMGAYLKALCPEIRLIGVEPQDSDAMARSVEAGRRLELSSVGIFADGVAVRKVGKNTFDLCRRYVDEFVRVDTDQICSAIRSIYQSTRAIVEPAGALAVAGMKKWAAQNRPEQKTLVAVNSGANMNFDRLRYVAERTEIGEQREALYAISIPEEAGALKRFCRDLVGNRNITEFNYRLAGRELAHIFVGIALPSPQERFSFARDVSEAGFEIQDLTENELAKSHVRYMVGGRSQNVRNERLYRFWFPERTGALTRFLETMGESWNISLFHYRSQGGEFGRVLIGLEIPDTEIPQLQDFLKRIGYRYQEETDNPAHHLFL